MARLDIEGIRKLFATDYPVVNDLRCIEVLIPDDDSYLTILAAFIAIIGQSWAWQGDLADRLARADLWKKAYAETDWTGCMNCTDILECLQDIFDEINTKLDSIQTDVTTVIEQVTEIQEVQSNNSASETTVPPQETGSSIYAGALALVRAMDNTNRALYAEAEAALVDNASEWITTILDFFPTFSAQGVNTGAELANTYFENQVATYEADYTGFEEPATCDLYCRIISNNGQLSYDVWGDWLEGLDTLITENAAAMVYAKYSPLRQTFLNQIAAFFNQDQSLQSYFDDLWFAYYTGTTDPIPVPYDCNCPYTVFVNAETAAPPGLDSGYEVEDTVSYYFVATGTWDGGTSVQYDADGNVGVTNPLAICPTADIYSLVARIDDGAWFFVGVENTIEMDANGTLFFAINDVEGAYGDNSGIIEVQISVP